MPSAKVRSHPEFNFASSSGSLELPLRPGADPQALLLESVPSTSLRKLGSVCPAIVSTESMFAPAFRVADVPISQRSEWPGKKLASLRHQIILSDKPVTEVEEHISAIEKLKSELNVPLQLATILCGRGARDSGELKQFLAPSVEGELAKLPDYLSLSEHYPDRMAPLGKAAWRIVEAIRSQQRVLIVSDYDADGNISAAILTRAIGELGGRCQVIQPDRVLDGYGLSDSVLERVQALKPDLVVTLDLGTSNKTQIEKLSMAGVETIVVDHHDTVAGKVASPTILANPKVGSEWVGYQPLCASELSWLLARGMVARAEGALGISARLSPTLLNDLLALSAIGTVGDFMSLTGLSRAITREGIAALKTSTIPALQVIASACRSPTLTAEYIAFQVVPLLNAPGRIAPGTPERPGTAVTLEFLLTNSRDRARAHFDELIGWNTKRKIFEEEGLQQARDKTIAAQRAGQIVHCGLVLTLDDTHEGVVGPIAARISEQMQCPAFVLTKGKDGNWKGSGRSPEGVSLMEILRCIDLQGLIDQYGGHGPAAGVRIADKNIARFQDLFGKLCQEVYGVLPTYPDPFSELPARPERLPHVKTWVKEYRPDLVMSVKSFSRDQLELAETCKALEPCGRGNAPLKVLLPKVRVVSKQVTGAGHLRLVLEDEPSVHTNWQTASQIEAVVFKRGIAHAVLLNLDRSDLVDLVVQPVFDQARSWRTGEVSTSVNVIIARPTAFRTGAPSQPRKVKTTAVVTSIPSKLQEIGLFDSLVVVPHFRSMDHFKDHFGITCLSEKVQFRERQISFVAREMAKDRAQPNENLLYRVNTGGGKTVIAFIKAAEVLSANPRAKVLYLTPQTDLVDQALKSAKEMLALDPDEFVEVTGAFTPKERRKNYDGAGRFFVGTPHTVEQDQTLANFSLVILDEVHFIRGDVHFRDPSKYPYHWVIDEVLRLQEQGKHIRIWAQSGTPAANREEQAALLQLMKARWSQAALPTGRHDWEAQECALPQIYRDHLFALCDAYRQTYREILEVLPDWLEAGVNHTEITKVRFRLFQALSSFTATHKAGSDDQTMPARGQFRNTRTALLRSLEQIESELKKENIKAPWIWQVRSRLHELDALGRLFEDLRSKGRSVFVRTVSRGMIEALYGGKGGSPVAWSHYKVRAFRRESVVRVLDWALQEPLVRSVFSEFTKVFPRSIRTGGVVAGREFSPSDRAPQSWQALLEAPTALAAAQSQTVAVAEREDSSKSKQKIAALEFFDGKLRPELLSAMTTDPKETAIVNLIHQLPAQAKIMVMCEKKFETQLMSERLQRAGISADWYAGKSVPKSHGLSENLERFRRGELRVLCCTSVGDTGHDIAQVTHIIRIVPLTSPIKNAQSKGRAARQEGLEGKYITVVIKDEHPDLDEMPKFYRGKTRLRTMGNIGS